MLSLSARVRPATIKIKQIDGTIIETQASRVDTIFSLKEQIMRQCFIPPQQQRLVFRGKVLCDDMTLGFYNINANDIVYLAIKHQKVERPKASALLSRLFELVNTLGESSSTKFALAIDEINQILEHPVLKSAARINPEIQQILDDAAQAVKSSERPLSEKTLQFVAQSQDMTFAQFEATPDGYRLLQSVMDEEPAPTTSSRASGYTNIVYVPKISEKALPNCWKKKKNVFQNTALSLTPRFSFYERQLDAPPTTWEAANGRRGKDNTISALKEKFADQLTALKNMGFTDEEGILQALRETGGNVQKAEQLLRKRPRPEC
ncbi:Ubiquitin family protein [Tritrichomonas foetus]|uniref:Ubiquitin family protein n=1 Tax=Tritrichomonas foetus TaxID=1144522 RepID=A0A1J4KJI8_9EUKA|nr:Ubiquitin family protein [Tritrichomonas foetus]|eukprot:OHT09862.1 Ubiquitin family protein [Tritrichomonas foetus]